MNIQAINMAILEGGFTNEQLTSIIDAVKFARARVADQTKRSLRNGSLVEFDSSKTGRTMQGTVTKIAIKYVTINTNAGLWRVPANMLRLVDKELA
jgi:hypothetical protein